MAPASKPRYVDLTNPSLTVECPRCGLLTARFVDHCRNDGYKLWPSSMDLPAPPLDLTVDYAARAHQLGIHLFPNSNYPFIICLGILFLGLAAIPFDSTVRIVLAVIGGLIFLFGVIGWVLVEDVRMFPSESPSAQAEVEH